MLLPAAIAANFLGVWLVRTMPTALFYRLVHALLFLISVLLLWQGLPGLWRA